MGGVITGVNSSNSNGGGVYVGSSGRFTMNGGTICGNAAKDGGGVYVDNSGTFTLNGGAISRNSALSGGGSLTVSAVGEGGTVKLMLVDESYAPLCAARAAKRNY